MNNPHKMGVTLLQSFLTIGFIACAMPIAYADTSNDTANLTSGFVLNVLGGVADLTSGFGTEVLPPPAPGFPPTVNTLHGSTDSATFEPGFGVGYDFITAPYTNVNGFYILRDVEVGVNAYYLSGNRTGQVLLGGSPSANFNNYNMGLTSWRVMLDSEWDFHPFPYNIIPFGEAGIGDAINSMNYSEALTPGSSGASVTLPNTTRNNFAYELGGGVKVPMNAHTQLSFRYLYSDLGEVQATSPALAQPLNVNLHSSSFLLGFTYLFGSN